MDVIAPAFARDLRRLTASLSQDDFGQRVLDAVRHLAVLRNFAVFLIPDVKRQQVIPSLVAGDLGEYQIRRNASDALNVSSYIMRLASLLQGTEHADVEFMRSRPDPADPRWPIYERSGLIERIGTIRVEGRTAYAISYYRSARDGPMTDEEERRLRLLLPMINDLVILRHKIVGIEAFQFQLRRDWVTSLHERRQPGFGALSKREVQVCDALAAGLSVSGVALELGVSENSVATLKRRAFRKLGIHSSGQLFALLLSEAANMLERRV